jgi:hypothetical protein
MFESEVKNILSIAKHLNIQSVKPMGMSKMLNRVKIAVMSIKNKNVRRKLDKSFAEVTRLYKRFLKDGSENSLNSITEMISELADESSLELNNKLSLIKSKNQQEIKMEFDFPISMKDKILNGFRYFMAALKWFGIILAVIVMGNIIINLLPMLLTMTIPILYSVVFIFVILPYAGVALYGLLFAAKGKFNYFVDILTKTINELYNKDWNFNTAWKLLEYAALLALVVITGANMLIPITTIPFATELVSMLAGFSALPTLISFFVMSTYLLYKTYKQLSETLGYSYFTGPFKAMSETLRTVGEEIQKLFYLSKDTEKIQAALERFKDFFSKLKIKGKGFENIQAEDIVNSSLNYNMIKNNVIDGLSY